MKATKLTIPENGKKVWREDAFDGVISRADLIAELEDCGFVHYVEVGEDYETWDLHLPKSIKPSNDDMSLLMISLDTAVGVKFSDGSSPTVGKVVDGKVMEFSEDTLIGVCMLQHNSKAYLLKDMWQGIRQQWERLCHYDACCRGEYKVEKLVKEWGID
tara:strand:+ start:79 stop:555 length:477 start_codon:yes stop_codon:yes gene_type:complete